MRFPFIDLQAQRKRIAGEIDAAVSKVLRHGAYILGPEVGRFEEKLADFVGAKHAISCANGTDALVLSLMAWGIGSGDAVFCPSFTYTATAEAIALVGASPVFVDVRPDTYNICGNSLTGAIENVKADRALGPKAVIAIDLFGQPADYPKIQSICENDGLKLISDCAQAFGCRIGEHSPAYWADAVTTSFFPAKPLGCYGDGGAILTNDTALDETLRALAFHGCSKISYDHDAIGMNSRLDTIQAAILIEKLKIFDDEIQERNHIAERYRAGLSSNVIRTPHVPDGYLSTWAQYTIEVDERDAFIAHMKAHEIPVASYYPRPVHLQTAYTEYPCAPDGLPVTNRIKNRVISLPMHAYLSNADQNLITQTAQSFFA